MNTFKRKALATAVLGTLGVAGSAHAIYQDPNNLGQVLIYPYYTVNSAGTNSWNTFISITNTTNQVKVVKVRFREGKNSQEVLDFNLYLSPNDMWTGAVIPSTSDSASPGHLVTADVSCTNPPIPSGGIDFRNFQYTNPSDGLAGTLDRTREGYAEVFEMAVILPGVEATAATHGASGTPTCTGLTGTTVTFTAGVLTAPTGGLMGAGTLINVNSGRDTMYNANAFAQWVNTNGGVYTDIGNDRPNFSNTSPANSVVVVPNGTTYAAGASFGQPSGIGDTYVSSWAALGGVFSANAGAMAASATMMHSEVINEYILDAATRSNTDWVLTFPTKRLFVTTVTATPPFTAVLTGTGACETIALNFFNREERTAGASGVDFSPTPPGAPANSLCWESTVLSFRNGSTNAPTTPNLPSLVLGSQNSTAVTVSSTFQNGWADVAFTGLNATTTGMVSLASSTTTPTGTYAPAVGGAGAAGTVTGSFATTTAVQTFHGLPVVGFMIRTFDNGNLTCGTATCQGSYGGSASHGYRTFVLPQTP